MKNPLEKFSIEDITKAFGLGVLFGRVRQRLAPYFNYCVEIKQKPTKGPMLTINITNEQQVTVHLKPQTPKGKPAAIDGRPTWAVVTGSATVNPSEDGLSAKIVSGDDLGTSEISVKADADLGEGVEEIADFVEIVVGGAKATSLGLTADAPENKPEVA